MLRNSSGCPTPLRGPRAASPRRRFSSYLLPEAWDRQRLGGSSVLSPQLLQEVTARPCLAQDTARAQRKPKPKARGPGYSNTPAGLGGRRAENRGQERHQVLHQAVRQFFSQNSRVLLREIKENTPGNHRFGTTSQHQACSVSQPMATATHKVFYEVIF